MKTELNEFKVKTLAILTTYEYKNDREKELISILFSKINYLNMYTLTDLFIALYQIRKNEKGITEDFKNKIKEITLLASQLLNEDNEH